MENVKSDLTEIGLPWKLIFVLCGSLEDASEKHTLGVLLFSLLLFLKVLLRGIKKRKKRRYCGWPELFRLRLLVSMYHFDLPI